MSISRTLAGSVAVVAVAALAACSPGPSNDDQDRSITIAIPAYQFPGSWDPAVGCGLWFIGPEPVYESLITWDVENNEFAPGLAESFELSDDGRTLSMDLVDDVLFSDGEPLTAEGVVAQLNDLVTREGSCFAHMAGEVTPTATGDDTLEIVFAQPVYDVVSYMLNDLTHMPIASPAAVADPSRFDDGPVGTGAYLMDEYVADSSVSFVRNPDYRSPDAYDFDTVTLRVFDDRIAALNALKSGQLDAAELDSTSVAEAEASGLVVHTGPTGFATIDLSIARDVTPQGAANAPETQDVRVRQAINMAIDRAAILEEIDGGYGRDSSQPFDPSTNEYVEGGDDRYPYDPERARELLAEAGYPDGFTLRLPYFPRSVGEVGRYRPFIEQSLADIGITIEWVDYADGADLGDALPNGELHGTMWQGYYLNGVRFQAEWILEHEDAVEPEVFEAAQDYVFGSLEEHAAARPILAEYLLDQAYYAPIAHSVQFWVTTPEVDVNPTNLPDYFIKLARFSAVD